MFYGFGALRHKRSEKIASGNAFMSIEIWQGTLQREGDAPSPISVKNSKRFRRNDFLYCHKMLLAEDQSLEEILHAGLIMKCGL